MNIIQKHYGRAWSYDLRQVELAGDVLRAGYTIDSFSGSGNSNMVVSGSTLTDENTGQRITVTQISKEVTSPDSTSSINLNKMLCLAVVDYVKAIDHGVLILDHA